MSTIGKVRELLVVFTPQHPTWRLSALAAELNWDMATTHRLANALVEIGLLDRFDENGYQLGIFTLELSAVYQSTNPRRHEVAREMESLAEETGLTAQVGVLTGDSVSIVGSREGDGPLRAAALLGQRLPLHATAAGKAILSQLSVEQAEAILPALLERFTERTITDRDELLAQLDEVRESGLARVEGELSDGLCAVAIPLSRGDYGSDPAALTCAGPSRTIIPEQWAQVESKLGAVASALPSGRDRAKEAGK